MAGKVREIYAYLRLTASGKVCKPNGTLGGFFCTTAGTLQVTEGDVAGGADIVSSFAVAVGNFYPFGFDTPTGAWAVLGGGAVGTFSI